MNDTLSGYSREELAEIASLLPAHAAEDDDEIYVEERVGAFRLLLRWLARLACLGALGLLGWYLYALSSLPDTPFDGVHAPLALTIGAGLAGILFLLWFDGKLGRLLLLLLGAAALAVSGLSMRWVDSARSGIHEYWAGLERGSAVLRGDLCYRIDAERFELRGAGRDRFAYARGYWPGAYSEAEFRGYFFSDAPMAPRADGWTCVART